MKKAAKFIAVSAIAISSLAMGTRVFAQRFASKADAPKEAPAKKPAKSNGVQTLCLGDTLDLAEAYGRKPKVTVFSKNNVKIRKSKLFSTGAAGSFSGRLYGAGRPMPITVKFEDCSARKAGADGYAYLAGGEKQPVAPGYSSKPKLPRSRARFSEIQPFKMAAGALFYTNEYGMPSIGAAGSKGLSIGRHIAGQMIFSGGYSLAKAEMSGITNFDVSPSSNGGSYTLNTVSCNTIDVFLSFQFDVGQFDIRLGRNFNFSVSFLAGPLLNMSIQRGTEFFQSVSVENGILKNGEGGGTKYSCFVLSAGGVLGVKAVIAGSWEISVKEYFRASRWRDYRPVGEGEIAGYSAGNGDAFSRLSTFVAVAYIIK